MDCGIFGAHQYHYDADQSDATKMIFKCLCGAQIVEVEDAPAGC